MISRRGVGIGCIITGFIVGALSFANVIRYAIVGSAEPFLFKIAPMAFSTSLVLTLDNIALFWIGYNLCYLDSRPIRKPFNPSQRIQLILAMISAVTLILTAIIGALKEL